MDNIRIDDDVLDIIQEQRKYEALTDYEKSIEQDYELGLSNSIVAIQDLLDAYNNIIDARPEILMDNKGGKAILQQLELTKDLLGALQEVNLFDILARRDNTILIDALNDINVVLEM